MPVTQLTDVITPTEFLAYMEELSYTSTALSVSGVMASNPTFEAQVGLGGSVFDCPTWLDLAAANDTWSANAAEPNLSNDNPAVSAPTAKITAENFIIRKSFLNGGFSAADFASELAGADAMKQIASRVAAWWNRQTDYRLVKTLYGVLLDSVANHTSDLVVDISTATTGAPVVVNGQSFTSPLVSRAAIIEAIFSLGDRANDVKAIAVHSSVYKQMSLNDELEFVRDADNNIMFATYAGLAVIQSDGLTLAGGNYLSVLFGKSAIGYAEGAGRVPVEVFRWPAQGNGGGVEELWTRKVQIIHPAGYKFTGNSVAGASPSGAELATAANWTRVTPQRKSIPLAFLVSK